MLYIVFFIVIILCITYPKNKLVSAFTLLFMFGLYAFNYSNPDYLQYEKVYYAIGNNQDTSGSASEIGFKTICKIFNILHFNYKLFLIVFAAINIYLLAKTVQFYTPYFNTVYALYLIFPFTLMTVQIRTFMAYTIALYATTFLFKSVKVKILKYLLLILLAATFHISALFFLVLIFAKYCGRGMCVLVSLSIFIMSNFINSSWFQELVSNYIPAYKIESWLSGVSNRSINGILLLFLIRLSFLILILLAGNCYNQYIRSHNNISLNNIQIVNYMTNAIILIFGVLALEMQVKEFERMTRVSMMCGYIILSYAICQSESKRCNRVIFAIFSFAYAVGYFVYYMYLSNPRFFVEVYRAIVENNVIMRVFWQFVKLEL